MRSALVLALVACGSSRTPAPAPAPEVTAAAPATGSATVAGSDASPPSCPATYGDAHGTCSPYSLACDYPEGSCACTYDTPAHCGGAVPPPPTKPPAIVWRCTPRPPALRADGCPGAQPSGPCSEEGKECSYVVCCAVHYTCIGGTWVGRRGECPP